MIPVIEIPGYWQDLVQFTENGGRPAYWHIPNGCYGKKYYVFFFGIEFIF